MNQILDWLITAIVSWLVGAPIYLPWILARVGIYKRWYFAPFIPPFSWRGWIQVWPMSAFFICAPFVGLLPVSMDERTIAWATVGVTGVLLAIAMIIWTPDWAKPAWQRRLENRYSHQEISRFIDVWKHMDFARWSRLIETEEGMEELVAMARGREGGHS